MDVRNAFLNGILNETVFISQPPGFKHETYPSQVCKRKRALYGLKRAPRAWFDRFSNFLFAEVFFIQVQLIHPCLYSRKGKVVLLYVDDMLIT